MVNPLENIKASGLQLPITESARTTAREFAQAQPTPEKAYQVLQNSLAVWVMNDYCQMMGIPTDLEHSDSWNPMTQMMSNVADLTLPGVGQLECRPVLAEADRCLVPPEVWDLRVGYVVVAIDDPLQTAHLLGFTPTVTEEEFPLTQLQPLENFFDHVYALKQGITTSTNTAAFASGLTNATAAVVNLSQWLEDMFEAGWQTVEAVLNPENMTPAMSFRGAGIYEETEPEPSSENALRPIRRAKLIDLAVQLGPQQVVLLVELQPESPQQTHIGLQVHPADGQPFLPPELELFVLESSDTVFMQAQSRQADNYIQLQFSGEPGEHFKVQINLGDACYQEEFMV